VFCSEVTFAEKYIVRSSHSHPHVLRLGGVTHMGSICHPCFEMKTLTGVV